VTQWPRQWGQYCGNCVDNARPSYYWPSWTSPVGGPIDIDPAQLLILLTQWRTDRRYWPNDPVDRRPAQLWTVIVGQLNPVIDPADPIVNPDSPIDGPRPRLLKIIIIIIDGQPIVIVMYYWTGGPIVWLWTDWHWLDIIIIVGWPIVTQLVIGPDYWLLCYWPRRTVVGIIVA